MKKVVIKKSDKSGKKMMAVFTDDNSRSKTIHFGSAGMSDYTIHKDKERRQRYLDRHRKNEDWSNPQTAGALSRWILWGDTTSLNKNIASFKKRFGYK
jgi:hypothetical protein